jgi:hypothetical protein
MNIPTKLSVGPAFSPVPVQAIPTGQRPAGKARLAQEAAERKKTKRKLARYGAQQRRVVDAKFAVAGQFEPKKGRR